MRAKTRKEPTSEAGYYDAHGVLDEIIEEEVIISLGDGLRRPN